MMFNWVAVILLLVLLLAAACVMPDGEVVDPMSDSYHMGNIDGCIGMYMVAVPNGRRAEYAKVHRMCELLADVLREEGHGLYNPASTVPQVFETESY